MKRISLLLIVLSFSIHQQACRSRQQANTQTIDSTSTTGSAAETAASLTISGHLSELGLTPESHWRGINLGDEFTKVKATEKGESFESDADHIGYTIELTNLESADMLYYQKNNKVSAIDIDLFLNSRQSVSDYQNQLSAYFTARYGASKPGAGGVTWTGSTGETVLLKDVSKGKDFGLKVKIGSSSGAATASAK